MCAPPGMPMDGSHLSRRNTQSTDRTLIGSDDGQYSLPRQAHRKVYLTSPVVQQDDTIWLQVPRDVLSTLLPNNLRQGGNAQVDYTNPSGNAHERAAASNNSKVKAWIRKTAVGFDFRLRRKIDADRDEVIDASFKKDVAAFNSEQQGQQTRASNSQLKVFQPLYTDEGYFKPELDASSATERAAPGLLEKHELDVIPSWRDSSEHQGIYELDGSHLRAELEDDKSPAADVPSTERNQSMIGTHRSSKPVKQYSRPNEDQLNFFPSELDSTASGPVSTASSVEKTSVNVAEGLSHSSSSSNAETSTTLVATVGFNEEVQEQGSSESDFTRPKLSISTDLPRSGSVDAPDPGYGTANTEKHVGSATESRTLSRTLSPREQMDSSQALDSSSPDAQPANFLHEMDKPSTLSMLNSEALQAIVEVAVKELRAEISKSDNSEGFSKNNSEHLKLAHTKRYETETDVEPQSPSDRKRLARRKNVPKRTRPSTSFTPRSTTEDIEVGLSQPQNDLQRRQTAGRRVAASAGPEAVWTAILRAQAKMLSQEDPLIWQARAAFGMSRQKQHQNCTLELLNPLYESRSRAADTLGRVHPLVDNFLANLDTLERLILARDQKNIPSPSIASLAPLVEQSRFSPTQNREPFSPLDDNQPATSSRGRQAVDEKLLQASSPVTHLSPIAHRGRNPASPSTDDNDNVPQVSQDPAEVGGDLVINTGAAHARPILSNLQTGSQMNAPHNTSPQTQESHLLPTQDEFWNAIYAPHEPRSDFIITAQLMLKAATKVAINNLMWLQRNYGPDAPVAPGKVRVKWTCSCGQRLFDDFEERREGAARELESFLNRQRTRGMGDSPSTPSRSSSRSFTESSAAGSLQSQSSMTSYGSSMQGSLVKEPGNASGRYPTHTPSGTPVNPRWLLVCANEDRLTPKVTHLDMSDDRHGSDRDLAMALRNHYFHLNKRWWRKFRLRGLTTIEFVQFECHINRFADIRKCPDMPHPSNVDYLSAYQLGDLVPPVGPTYLLHLFKHPEDYDDETCTRDRVPKRKARLRLGVGWGIHLVEGFLAERVWLLVNTFFLGVSLIFAVAWVLERNDVQGAFGVAQWICMLSVCATGYAQAWLA